MERSVVTADEFGALVGKEIGVSGWVEIDQARINAFATTTLDDQFIHVDPERAKETRFGGTVAHGFLTLSMLSWMNTEVLPPIADTRMGVNYGLNSLRFITPVRAGQRIRGRFTLLAFSERAPGQYMARTNVSVEIEDGDRPALVAEWLTLVVT